MGRVQGHRCLDRHKMCHHLSKTSATLMSRQRTYEPRRTEDQKGRCPASELVISGHKAIKQKLLSKPSFGTSFLTKLMRFTDSFYFAICTLEKHGEPALSIFRPILPFFVFPGLLPVWAFPHSRSGISSVA